MNDRFSLTIPGAPVPQQRARKGKHGWYLPEESREYQDRIEATWQASGHSTLRGPVVISAMFVLPRKPSHLTKKGELRKGAPAIPRVDLDNLIKNLLDGLQPDACTDDSLVVCFSGVHKRYVRPQEEPCTVVAAWRSYAY